MKGRKHPCRFPLPESLVARGGAAELLGDGVPLTSGPSAIDNAVEDKAIVNARPTTPWVSRTLRNQQTNDLPDLVGNAQELALHAQ